VDVIIRIFAALHFPTYAFYYVIHGLRVLTKLGYGIMEGPVEIEANGSKLRFWVALM